MGTALAVPFFLGARHLRPRSYHSYFAICCHYETARPGCHFLVLEYFANPTAESAAIGRAEPDQQDAEMRSWGESSKIGEVQVLGDQESLVSLRRFPQVAIAAATQILLGNGVNVVVEARQDRGQAYGKVLVELEFH
jgi:hypothetical protein